MTSTDTHPAAGSRRTMPRRAVSRRGVTAAVVAATAPAALGLALVAAAPTASAATTTTTTASTLVDDSLDRVVRAGWGTAAVGGAWSMPAETTSASAVDGARGSLTVPSGVSRTAVLRAAVALDSRSLVRFSVPSLPTSGKGVWFAVSSRVDGATQYQTRVRVGPGGTLELSTLRTSAARTAAVGAPKMLPVRVAAGQSVLLRAQTTGRYPAVLAAKAWLAGAGEPSWQQVVTDAGSTSIKDAGATGLWAYTSTASGSATVDVEDVHVDKLTTTTATPTSPAPSPSSSPAPAPSSTPTAGTGRPDATNTGVPDGTRLTPRWGDLVITTPGAVYDSLDIHGFVRVQAPNVTIRRSIIRGGVAHTSIGLVTNTTATATNFVIEDSTLVPASPSVYIDGLKGGNYTARRLDISGTVDGAKVHGDNVRIERSWIHDTHHYSSDPYQGGGPSHNDGVQVLGGADTTITGNNISGAANSAIQVTQDYSAVRGLKISGNWMGNGNCTVNVSQKGGGPVQGLSITSNRFSRNSALNCAVIIPSTTSFTATDDLWVDTLTPVLIRRN